MQINTELNHESAQKLTYIKQQTNQEESEIIEQAIALYYRQLCEKHHSSDDSLKRLRQSPFIGSFEAEPNLSVNSKAIVHKIFEQK